MKDANIFMESIGPERTVWQTKHPRNKQGPKKLGRNNLPLWSASFSLLFHIGKLKFALPLLRNGEVISSLIPIIIQRINPSGVLFQPDDPIG